MRLYAELSRRRNRQIVADLAVVGWGTLWIWAAAVVHDAIDSLSSTTDKVAAGGTRLQQSLAGAAEEARGIPLAGRALADRIAEAAGAAGSVADAGATGSRTIGQAALIAALAVSLGPILPTLVVWLWFRLRWIRRAGVALRLRDEQEGLDLLALRAVATASLDTVRRISSDPAGGWRSKDLDTLAALASLELSRLGLRSQPPAARHG